MVVWQSFVVENYRRFFRLLAAQSDWQVELVSPHRFRELGLQDTLFQKDSHVPEGKADKAAVPITSLFSFSPHIQIMILPKLGLLLKKYFTNSSNEWLLCMAEPYSLTALIVWLQARIFNRRLKIIFYAAQNIDKNFSFPLRWIRNIMYRKAHAIVYIGPEQKKILQKTGYCGPMIPFPLWYNSSVFSVKKFEESWQRLEQEHSILGKSPKDMQATICFVGTLNHQKGIHLVFDMLKEYIEEARQIRVLIVGKGSLSSFAQESVVDLQKMGLDILYLGLLRPQLLSDLFNISDFLLVPSITLPDLKEQFGRVVIEAGGCGCRSLTSNSGHLPHLTRSPSCVFKEGDIHDMWRVLSLAIKQLPSISRHDEAEYYKKRYSDRSLAKNFAEHLNHI